jgi:hypothetical protein
MVLQYSLYYHFVDYLLCFQKFHQLQSKNNYNTNQFILLSISVLFPMKPSLPLQTFCLTTFHTYNYHAQGMIFLCSDSEDDCPEKCDPM